MSDETPRQDVSAVERAKQRVRHAMHAKQPASEVGLDELVESLGAIRLGTLSNFSRAAIGLETLPDFEVRSGLPRHSAMKQRRQSGVSGRAPRLSAAGAPNTVADIVADILESRIVAPDSVDPDPAEAEEENGETTARLQEKAAAIRVTLAERRHRAVEGV